MRECVDRIQKAIAAVSIFILSASSLASTLFFVQAADPLFSDGFESGDFSSWSSFTTPQWSVSAGEAQSGSYRAEARGNTSGSGAVLAKATSTVGYKNVTIRYWYRVIEDLEANDSFAVEWFDGETWQTAASYSNRPATAGYTEAFHILPSKASHNPDFQVRFRARLNQSSDSVSLDDIEIGADPLFVSSNPPLAYSCGLDIALVLDSSGSISSSELAQMKAAVQSFVDVLLPGTPTLFSVIDFDNTARVLQPFTGDADLVRQAIGSPASGGATNWEDAFVKAVGAFDPRPENPNLVIFASDGNPTVNNGPGGGSTGGTTDGNDLFRAVDRANEIKSAGTRIVALAIGDNLSLENLQAVSGPVVNEGLLSDVITTDFSTLAADLADLAEELCGGTITIRKLNDYDGNLLTEDDRTPEAGWEIDIDGTASNPDPVVTDALGYTSAIEVAAGTYTVTETLPEGYYFRSASCEKNGSGTVGSPSGTGVSGVTVGKSDVLSCVFINHKNLPPVITVLGENPLEIVVRQDAYVEAGAVADDPEDGLGIPLAPSDIDASDVDTNLVGTYEVRYTFTDSRGAAAALRTRTVLVVPGDNECNDGVNNDHDDFLDYPRDPGCESILDPTENEPPVISLMGPNPQVVTLGGVYEEFGAVANDAEDGDNIPVTDIASEAVDTDAIGSYTVTYRFTDSDGAPAADGTRQVSVAYACADGRDNDGDTKIDSDDAGCAGVDDNDENAKPVIELVGLSLVSLTAGDPYHELGAVAHDEEDGDQPAAIGGDAVLVSSPGTYFVRYTYTDSRGASADEVVRMVVVNEHSACSDGEDNDEDGSVDMEDVGCSDASDNDESNPLFDCNDGADNDNDGWIDMADSDCTEPTDDAEAGSGGSGGSGSSGGGGSGGGNGPIISLPGDGIGGSSIGSESGSGGSGEEGGILLGQTIEQRVPGGAGGASGGNPLGLVLGESDLNEPPAGEGVESIPSPAVAPGDESFFAAIGLANISLWWIFLLVLLLLLLIVYFARKPTRVPPPRGNRTHE